MDHKAPHEAQTSSQNHLPKNENDLPPLGEPVWVKGDKFRCLAYLDSKGKWRYFSNNAEIMVPVKWIHAGELNKRK